jgi:hypothetical protein
VLHLQQSAMDKDNVAMGVRYFEHFPSAFVERIEKLRHCGIDNEFEAMKYTVLVYIAINQEKEKFVSVPKNDIKFKEFKNIFKQIYNRDYTLNVTSIQNSANGFRGQYLGFSFSIRSTKADGKCSKYRTPIATLSLSLQKREHINGKPITVLHLQQSAM